MRDHMRTLPLLTLVIATVAAGMACQSETSLGPPSTPATSLRVLPSAITLGGGKSLRLTATVHNADGSTTRPDGVTWVSADGIVASVDAGGMVLGLQPGQARIIATWQDNRAFSLITVAAPDAQKPKSKPRPECLAKSTAEGSEIPTTDECI